MVQARWGHINQDYSLLTKIQAILLDGALRPRARRPQPRAAASSTSTAPPASGGATAIDDAGGWQHDTLTEDLDLSYRAQLRGWQFVFLPDLVAPAEVPVEMNAFKSQQHRWAKGSIQTCRKLLPRILRSNLPLGVKAEAFFHLTANFNYLLMCVLSILMFPAMVDPLQHGLVRDAAHRRAAVLRGDVLGLQLLHGVPARDSTRTGVTRLKYLPFLMSIGIGLCDQQHARGVRGAVQQAERIRAHAEVPASKRDGDEWVGKKYRQSVAVQPLIELALGLYFTATVFYALVNQIYGTLPFLVLFQIGFLYTGLLSIVQQYAGESVMLKAPEVAK